MSSALIANYFLVDDTEDVTAAYESAVVGDLGTASAFSWIWYGTLFDPEATTDILRMGTPGATGWRLSLDASGDPELQFGVVEAGPAEIVASASLAEANYMGAHVFAGRYSGDEGGAATLMIDGAVVASIGSAAAYVPSDAVAAIRTSGDPEAPCMAHNGLLYNPFAVPLQGLAYLSLQIMQGARTQDTLKLADGQSTAVEAFQSEFSFGLNAMGFTSPAPEIPDTGVTPTGIIFSPAPADNTLRCLASVRQGG